METTRSISKITVNFFKTLDVHASKLTEIVEEAQAVNDQKLSELEKKFEVGCSSPLYISSLTVCKLPYIIRFM